MKAKWLFSFAGKVGRPAYALWSITILTTQYPMVWALFRSTGQDLPQNWLVLILPLQSLIWLRHPSTAALLLTMIFMVIAAWIQSALAFRRAIDANISGWIAAFVIAPTLQIPLILILCFVPPCAPEIDYSKLAQEGRVTLEHKQAIYGVLAGLAVTLFAVTLGALVFGTYGFGMFLVSPFIIGATTAYIANSKGDIGSPETAALVGSAAVVGALALVGVALEGVGCLIVAAPIGLVLALLGGALGRSMALQASRSAKSKFISIFVLPVVFASESLLPPSADFDTVQTIEISAAPEIVWQSVVHMKRIEEPIALPFRLGVAYPLSGEIIGEGIGARRLGEFSTGTAVEEVTEWIPDRKLAFVVTKDIPGMRELSPYEHVHAPHVVGYFRTTRTSFELKPLADGGTKIIERTSHQLRLDPIPYWLPLARWIVGLNNARVLTHLKHQAEASPGL
jgi:uncharacterized membrane protein YhaH (DUF805 family)